MSAGKRDKGQIGNHPAIGDLIVEDKWVANILIGATRRGWAHRGKKRIESCRTGQRRARLVKYLDR